MNLKLRDLLFELGSTKKRFKIIRSSSDWEIEEYQFTINRVKYTVEFNFNISEPDNDFELHDLRVDFDLSEKYGTRDSDFEVVGKDTQFNLLSMIFRCFEKFLNEVGYGRGQHDRYLLFDLEIRAADDKRRRIYEYYVENYLKKRGMKYRKSGHEYIFDPPFEFKGE